MLVLTKKKQHIRETKSTRETSTEVKTQSRNKFKRKVVLLETLNNTYSIPLVFISFYQLKSYKNTNNNL